MCKLIGYAMHRRPSKQAPIKQAIAVVPFCLLSFLASYSAGAENSPKELQRYDLKKLIARAQKHYPGIAAAEQGLEAMQRKMYQAKWAWVPRGKVSGMFAPTPEIRCIGPNGEQNAESACVATNTRDISFNFNGVFARITLELAMPLYTFNKLASVKRAAHAGIGVKTAAVTAAQQDSVLNVTKAYWGLKAARELVYTIKKGRKHLDKAITRLKDELEDGTGEATVTDLLRLKTAEAEIEARLLEAQRLQSVALTALAALTALEVGHFDIDADVIDASSRELKELTHYVDNARQQRPESKMLKAAFEAAKAKAALEKARLYPDLLLVGRAGVGGATNIDDPKNAFLNDPFNFTSGAMGLALNWNLNTVEQYGKLKEAQAEVRQADAKRSEAKIGIAIEVRKTYFELREAQDRLRAHHKGAKAAKSWLVATSQNLSAGLAEPKDLTDALVAYFKMRLSEIQAMYDINVGWAKLTRTSGGV